MLCLFKLPVVSALSRVSAPLLENAILAFGNGSDVKTSASQPGMPSPATDNQSPFLATTAPGVSMETEQNILRAQIPTQVRREREVGKKQRCETVGLMEPLRSEVEHGFVCFNLLSAADGWGLRKICRIQTVSHKVTAKLR